MVMDQDTFHELLLLPSNETPFARAEATLWRSASSRAGRREVARRDVLPGVYFGVVARVNTGARGILGRSPAIRRAVS